MADRMSRPCKHPGCPELTRDRLGYCINHTRPKTRDNPREMGYDRPWETFREKYLKDHPLCCDCEEKGRYEPATEIHHVKKLRDFPNLKYDESNLRGLSKSCHSTRTARGE